MNGIYFLKAEVKMIDALIEDAIAAVENGLKSKSGRQRRTRGTSGRATNASRQRCFEVTDIGVAKNGITNVIEL